VAATDTECGYGKSSFRTWPTSFLFHLLVPGGKWQTVIAGLKVRAELDENKYPK
jgi:hypothetical protein